MMKSSYKILFEKNADPLLIFDTASHQIIDCNLAMSEKYGYSRNELCKMTFEDLQPKKDQDQVTQILGKDKDLLPVLTHITKKGEHLTIELNSRPITHNGRQANICTIRDVAPRLMTKKELEKQNLLQKAMRKISESSRESDLNVLFKIIHQQVKKLMPAENFYIALLENYEKSTYYFPYYKDLLNKDDIKQNMTITLPGTFTDWVRKNGSLLLDKHSVEQIISKKINISIDPTNIGEHSASWMGVQLKGKKDHILGVIVVQDYTKPDAYSGSDFNLLKMASETIGSAIQYNQSQLDLEKSEKMFRTLVETAPVGINEIDLDKNFVYTNKVFAQMLGFKKEKEIFGKKLKDFTSSETYNDLSKKIKRIQREGTPGVYETQLLSKNGAPLDVIFNCTPVGFDIGKVSKFIIVVTNITEQKQSHKARILAQKHAADQEKHALVGQVAGKMAHDFNNILGAIMGNAEISILDCEDKEIRQALEIILEQTIRGRNLTKNLVAFAKDQEPKQEFFYINDKINLAISLLKKDLDSIRVRTDLEKNIPPLLADPGMIEHSLINLIQNSVHATSQVENAIIQIKAYHLEQTICIEIQDNGCGIPKKHHDSIFTPAFTLKGSNDISNAYSKNIKGTGYGMSNVKMYIEKHHGKISFVSDKDKGTIFLVQLPIRQEGLTHEEVIEVQKNTLQTHKHILIVEDETPISGIQSKVLSQMPFEHHVDIAENGQIALELLNKKTYDLVSLDYILPGNLNGMDIYHYIREKDKKLPVLFISGNIEFIESIKGLKQEDKRINHLSKPTTNKHYVETINELLIEE
ncbi:MAG: PAS domain S-box protein [Desulfobacteraceae bacterium]|nr:PAS domain S-box protein [Desulfobacteraceae bacterium]